MVGAKFISPHLELAGLTSVLLRGCDQKDGAEIKWKSKCSVISLEPFEWGSSDKLAIVPILISILLRAGVFFRRVGCTRLGTFAAFQNPKRELKFPPIICAAV